jgi:hypothetical protein
VASNYSPVAVHIAIGVVMDHDRDPPQAIAMLSSSAFTAGRTITDLAREIIDDPTSKVVGEQPVEGDRAHTSRAGVASESRGRATPVRRPFGA